jgi:hypothetical protein
LNCTQISQQPLLLMFLQCLCNKHHQPLRQIPIQEKWSLVYQSVAIDTPNIFTDSTCFRNLFKG